MKTHRGREFLAYAVLGLGAAGCGSQAPSFKENAAEAPAALRASSNSQDETGKRRSADASVGTDSGTSVSRAEADAAGRAHEMEDADAATGAKVSTGANANDASQAAQPGRNQDHDAGTGDAGGSGGGGSNADGSMTGGGSVGSNVGDGSTGGQGGSPSGDGTTGGNSGGDGTTGGSTGGDGTTGGNTGGDGTTGGNTGGDGNTGGSGGHGGAGEDPAPSPGCVTETALARAQQSVTLTWSPVRIPSDARVTVRGAGASAAVGTAVIASAEAVRYTAPARVSAEGEMIVSVVAADGKGLGSCSVRLMPDESLGVGDDGATRGLVGNVYRLPVDTPKLPNFDAMTPMGSIVATNWDVPNRDFTYGFPGVDKDLVEWFGIRFDGTLTVEASGSHAFRLTADDGAKLYVDGKLVIDNDGLHSVKTVDGKVNLSAGTHAIRVEYYQGPRYHIALQLFWQKPGSTTWAIVPPENLGRPAGK